MLYSASPGSFTIVAPDQWFGHLGREDLTVRAAIRDARRPARIPRVSTLNIRSRDLNKFFSFAFGLSFLSIMPTGLMAQQHHPPYQHAMSNLSAARERLEKFTRADVASDVQAATEAVKQAYQVLRTAAHDDDKDLAHRFPPDLHFTEGGELHHALHLLEGAHVSQQEDDSQARPLQQRALGYIDGAIQHVRAALGEPNAKGGPLTENVEHSALKHPAYLHALADLRHARAHVDHDKRGGLQAEEKAAVDEIDRAIGDIKKAAIDDGKDLNDHPPIDAKLDHAGLLHKALALLDKAKNDISEDEDNNFGQGLRQRALDHVEKSKHHLEAALKVTEGR